MLPDTLPSSPLPFFALTSPAYVQRLRWDNSVRRWKRPKILTEFGVSGRPFSPHGVGMKRTSKERKSSQRSVPQQQMRHFMHVWGNPLCHVTTDVLTVHFYIKYV